MRRDPFVIGPAEVPRILSVDDAASWPELAVLSSITHGNARPAAEAAAGAAAALAAVDRLDDPRATLYADIVLAALGAAARAILEAQMRIEGYVYKTDFLRRAFDEGKEKGRAEGARRTLLVVLDSRGLSPTAEELRRIADCSSESMLDGWVRKAVVVDRVADLFE